MTIKLITGSIQAFDTTGELLDLKRKGVFVQWYYTKNGWRRKLTKHGKRLEASSFFNMVQTTGSGKTLLAAIKLYKAKKAGMKTAANMDINFSNKKVESLAEFVRLEGYEVLLDDIKHVIKNYHCDASALSIEFSNASRKKKNELLITGQRLVGYVPPAIRDIADEIYVPWIRCLDATRRAPDWRPTDKKYMPLEIYEFKFSGSLDYIGHTKYDLTGKTGQIILNSFNTMKISDGLK